MKRTKTNMIVLLKAKCLKAREMEDWCAKKGKPEREVYWRRARWSYEDMIELLTSEERFKEEWDLHTLECNLVLEKGL